MMKCTLPTLSLMVLLCALTACQPAPKNAPSLDGVWESIGFGKILEIKAGQYSYFEHTDISCLPVSKGAVADFGSAIQLQGDTLSITSGTNIYHYFRTATLPDRCQQSLSPQKAKDLQYNFEIVTQTIKEHYAYFDLNRIHWDSLYAATKEKIKTDTSEVQVYLAIEEMIEFLNDNHGYIEANEEVYQQIEQQTPATEPTEEQQEYGDFQVAQMVADHYLEESLTQGTSIIQWGKMKDNIGYIQVKAMWLYADLQLSDSAIQANGYVGAYVDAFNRLTESTYIQAEVAGVAKIMDQVMQDLKDTKSLILDVRFNGGGQDAVSAEILSRFNDRKRPVAIKKAVYKEGFTPSTTVYLDPSTSPYLKPVYLLTSRQSASATDFLILAARELDHIQQIGTPSQGALSDALERSLPNGWHFSVSNMVYTDLQGKCYENIGVPPKVVLAYPEDRQLFFRGVAENLEEDMKEVLRGIGRLE